jgi:hypothetical protein
MYLYLCFICTYIYIYERRELVLARALELKDQLEVCMSIFEYMYVSISICAMYVYICMYTSFIYSYIDMYINTVHR